MIPSLPAFYDMQYTEKDGKLTSAAHLYNDQTFQVLNAIVVLLNAALMSEVSANSFILDGLVPPTKTTAQITLLEPTAANGTMWYNSNLKKLQFKADTGVIETITST